MPSSLASRSAASFAATTASAIVAPASGMNGTTSVAPMRGWAPWCFVRSIRFSASRAPATAPSTTSRCEPASVMTVRLWSRSLSTSSSVAPFEANALATASIVAGSRPSLMLGTHSSRRVDKGALRGEGGAYADREGARRSGGGRGRPRRPADGISVRRDDRPPPPPGPPARPCGRDWCRAGRGRGGSSARRGRRRRPRSRARSSRRAPRGRPPPPRCA